MMAGRLVPLLFLWTPSVSSQASSDVSQVSDNAFGPELGGRCTVVTLLAGGRGRRDQPALGEGRHGTVVVDANGSKALESLIGKTSTCAVVLVTLLGKNATGGGLGGAGGMLFSKANRVAMRAERSLIVALAPVPPRNPLPPPTSRPVVWIHQRSGRVYTRCPTVASPPVANPFQLRNIWKRGSDGVARLAGGGDDSVVAPCGRMLMGGQTLKVGLLPAGPKAIPPRNRDWWGIDVRMFQVLGQKFNFTPVFSLPGPNLFNTTVRSYVSGPFHKVLTGQIDFTTGLLSLPQMAFSSATPGYYFDELRYLSRRPMPLPSYGNLRRPFSAGVWAGALFSLATLSLAFFLAYWVYRSWLGEAAGRLLLLRAPGRTHWTEFVLFTFFRLVEPGRLMWFQKGIAGWFLLAVWYGLALCGTMFYTSNLRAHLIASERERKIDTTQDVIDNGKTVWIFRSSVQLSVDYLEKTGQRNSSLYEVAQLAAKNGGYYDLLKQVVWMFPNGMPEDIQANRSVMVCPTHSLPHLSSTRPNGIFSKARLYIGKEAIFNYHFAIMARKFSQAPFLLRQQVQQLFDMGFWQRFAVEFLPPSAYVEVPKRARGEETLVRLSMEHLLDAVVVLVGGLTLSVVQFLFWEWSRRRPNRGNSGTRSELELPRLTFVLSKDK